MKRMLINATHSEEIRVALADGQKLYNLDIDIPGQDRKKGNIYKGKITRVEPSLEAAFVDYGSNRHGFLPFKEISKSYYTKEALKSSAKATIAKAVKEGTEVIIQVNKEERGNKGAAISTYISLAGRYLVYMPENPKAGGISRRIEGKARQDLKTTLNKINIPKDSGVIVRTAGIGRSADELDWDLNYLDQVWTAIKTVSANRKAPFFIYQESDIFIRALRDYLRPDVSEILIDNKEIYEKARDFMQQVMPHNLKKLSYYNDTIPLFSRYQIESQIQSAFSREVQLPSGGSLVIDHTEAMISIDINSARATKGADIEETALNTNLEAADEIARQLRIRDLGGLVVIDFIDMRNHKNQKSVEQQLNEAVSNDRARIQTSKISKFGLLEMSRQRLKSSINESSQFACPRCSGHGFIRNIESLSVSILRLIEEEALKPETGKVIAQVPTKVSNFIINDKRDELTSLESRHSVPIFIIANEHYQSPQFDVKRLKNSEIKNFDINNIELNKPENEEIAENQSSQASHQKRQVAAVDVLVPDSQVPERTTQKENEGKGVFAWLGNLFGSNSQAQTQSKPKQQNRPTKSHKNQTNNKNNNQNKKAQPQTKKPVHNKSKPNNKNQTQNKASKSQQNKQVNKNQQNKPNQKPVQKQTQSRVHKQEQKIDKQSVSDKPVKNQDKLIKTTQEPTKQVENKIQRPLGSVASYAANKAKQTQKESQNKVQSENPKDNLKTTESVKKATESHSKSSSKKPENSEVKKTDEKTVKGNKVAGEITQKAVEKQEPKENISNNDVKAQVSPTPKTPLDQKPKTENKDDKQDKTVIPKSPEKTETKSPIEKAIIEKVEKAEKVEKSLKAEKNKISAETEKTKKPVKPKENIKPAKKEKASKQATEQVTKDTTKKPKQQNKTATEPKVKKESKVDEKLKKDKVKSTKKITDLKKDNSKTEKPKKVSPQVKKATVKKKIPDPTQDIDFDI